MRLKPRRRNRRTESGSKTGYLPGVNLIGFARAEIGLGDSVRMAARSLERAGVPNGILNYAIRVAQSMGDTSWAHKEIAEPLYRCNIFHVNADTLMSLRSEYGPSYWNGRYNIGYWHWELPDFPDDQTPAFSLVDEVWAPTSFVQEIIARKTNKPVLRIPHGIEVEVAPHINRDTFGLPHDRFLFLMMYDIQSTTMRKNPQAVIQAFKLAFDPNDPRVGLVLKVNNSASNPAEFEEVRAMIAGYGNIYVIDRILPRAEVNSLLGLTDSYVSLHRSEGFGLGMAEAMYLGKPVIGTNWSGNTDFMRPDNSCLIDYRFTQVGGDFGPYKAYQIWAEPSVEHAASCMRGLLELPEWRSQLGANAAQTIRNEFSPEVSGAMMRQRLEELGLIQGIAKPVFHANVRA